jgi:hypothetical protein
VPSGGDDHADSSGGGERQVVRYVVAKTQTAVGAPQHRSVRLATIAKI